MIQKHVKKIGGCIAAVIMGMLAALPSDEVKTSKPAIEYLINLESCQLKPYSCSAGVLTDGIGNTHNVKPGQVITEEQAFNDFLRNLKQKESRVNALLKTPVDQGVWDSLILFTFNVGEGKLKNSTLLRQINSGVNKKTYCDQYRRWIYVNKKDCRIKSNNCGGIPKRREVERDFCLGKHS